MRYILGLLFAVIVPLLTTAPAFAIDVKVAVLRVDYARLLPTSRYDLRTDDFGFAGAALADEDNSTTGGFLGHTYETKAVATTPDQADAALTALLEEGIRLLIILAEAEDLLRLTDLAAQEGALVFNAAAPETNLRNDQCRPNLLHTVPSHAMLADALAQFLVWKKWTDWLIVSGSNSADRLIADAYRQSAAKFGARVVEEKIFEDTGGARRTDSGYVQVQRNLPVFLQDTEGHDVIIAADGTDYFARFMPYHLWTPRPVTGSAGLKPTAMHAAHEAYGATQFQNRFERLTNRRVTSEDFSTWLALRVVGEAVTRANTADPEGVRAYALSDQFELAAFKGQKVTFRDWNGQLRQPILLHDDQITVSISPQQGFLHQNSPLDTLGTDRPETTCTAFN